MEAKKTKCECPNCRGTAEKFEIDGRPIVNCKDCGWFEIAENGEAMTIEPMPELLQPKPDPKPVEETQPEKIEPEPKPEPQEQPEKQDQKKAGLIVNFNFEDD